jgi:hypothetical protein
VGVAISTPDSGRNALLILLASYPAYRWVQSRAR